MHHVLFKGKSLATDHILKKDKIGFTWELTGKTNISKQGNKTLGSATCLQLTKQTLSLVFKVRIKTKYKSEKSVQNWIKLGLLQKSQMLISHGLFTSIISTYFLL
jgi:hypothetical protein